MIGSFRKDFVSFALMKIKKDCNLDYIILLDK